ncbi:MAG: redoxin domain-containing protein [Calditrichaceae bacterium]
MQLGQLLDIEKNLTDLGYQIIAVSADRPEKLSESVDRHKLTYKLLSDTKLTSAKAFGIAYKMDDETVARYKTYEMDIEAASGESHHILPVPAVFIIGTDGLIKFEYVNPDHRVRLEPEILLSAAKSYLKKD